MVTTQEHITITESMLEHAEERLQAGDLVQASEKGWGAVAHYLKAVAKQRGWQNRSQHRDFFVIKDRLANETDDPDRISLLFREANALHQNFYEPLYLPSDVKGGIDSAKSSSTDWSGRMCFADGVLEIA